MIERTPTLDPRAREDHLGRASRRIFGPVPTVEYIPPEGSTETEPPYNSEQIRYWTVINGRRQRRHPGNLAALRQSEARSRLLTALAAMLRATPRRITTVAVAFVALLGSGAAGSVMLYQANADYSGSTALSLYFAAFAIGFVFAAVFGALRVRALFIEGCKTADLSQDEANLLFLPVALASTTAFVVLWEASLLAANLIVSALGVGV